MYWSLEYFNTQCESFPCWPCWPSLVWRHIWLCRPWCHLRCPRVADKRFTVFFHLTKFDRLRFHLKQNLTSMVQFLVGSHPSDTFLMMFHRSPKTRWILNTISSKSPIPLRGQLVSLLSLRDEIHSARSVIVARLSLWGLFEANFEVFHLISCKGLTSLGPVWKRLRRSKLAYIAYIYHSWIAEMRFKHT